MIHAKSEQTWISLRSIEATAPAAPDAIEALHLPCGERAIVRPARPRDAGMIQTYIQGLSSTSRHNRFLGSVNELSARELYRMTHGDSRARPEALIAEGIESGARIMIAEVRYALLGDGVTCEFALSVAEAWRRKELGTLLIGIVACRATALGARALVGDVFRSNEPMLKFARASGFTLTEPLTGAGLVRVTKDLSLTRAAQPCGMGSADSWMIAA
jgi:GNAT superfamily N-acetyltransferase